MPCQSDLTLNSENTHFLLLKSHKSVDRKLILVTISYWNKSDAKIKFKNTFNWKQEWCPSRYGSLKWKYFCWMFLLLLMIYYFSMYTKTKQETLSIIFWDLNEHHSALFYFSSRYLNTSYPYTFVSLTNYQWIIYNTFQTSFI